MKSVTQIPPTLLEAVRQSLALTARYNSSDATAPAAILWTDADGQWEPLVAKLKPLMPELFTLGVYAPGQKIGPAIWLRCIIERALPDIKIPNDSVPVIYIPNVSRQTLRAAEECPDELKPLVELQYRGAVWTQVNGKDWTVEAFFVSEDGGLGLDVSRDQKTRQAMQGALTSLVTAPLSVLRGKRLEAEDFDKLMIGDTVRDLLLWLNDPAATRDDWDAAKWTAFCSRCKAEYDFDPVSDGEIVGGEKLGMRQNAWLGVWQRFAESPGLYPGIPNLLRRAKPSSLIFDKEPWPSKNEKAESTLKDALSAFTTLSPADARKKILALEAEHGERRSWVWAKLGQTSLANALGHLAILAKETEHSIGGDTPDSMAETYSKSGFLADDAVLKALDAVKAVEDIQAVTVAVRALYLPWLDDGARRFQETMTDHELPDAAKVKESSVSYAHRECILFCDGLRFDLGRRLVILGEERHLRAQMKHAWAALPTVTGTAKPAVSPVSGELGGASQSQDFQPAIEKAGMSLNNERFKDLLIDAGYQMLGQTETGDPRPDDAKAWTEFGEFDKLGHTLQSKLAAQIDEQLELLLQRITQLLDAGWKSVRVITDHGWLLLPGGLPVTALPKYLTESKWSRCASIKEGANVTVPVARWHWNVGQYFAHGPGISCFGKGNDYAHGGLSLQECLIPQITFYSDRPTGIVSVAVKDVQWIGMRCRAVIEPIAEGLTADLRTKVNDPGSSLATPKPFDVEGRAGLLVEDDALAGTAVNLVIIDSTGRVLAKQPTTVGGES